ncbi:hypothetical protein L6R52_06250 [Myxococcota bacterium]|nr:hypothetical protein [Myxococcota bacterium]
MSQTIRELVSERLQEMIDSGRATLPPDSLDLVLDIAEEAAQRAVTDYLGDDNAGLARHPSSSGSHRLTPEQLREAISVYLLKIRGDVPHETRRSHWVEIIHAIHGPLTSGLNQISIHVSWGKEESSSESAV